jgi:hypothetical protein
LFSGRTLTLILLKQRMRRKGWHAWRDKFRTLLKRAYESNTLEELRDFLSVESLELQLEVV